MISKVKWVDMHQIILEKYLPALDHGRPSPIF